MRSSYFIKNLIQNQKLWKKLLCIKYLTTLLNATNIVRMAQPIKLNFLRLQHLCRIANYSSVRVYIPVKILGCVD